MLKVMIVDDDTNVRKCLRKLIPWTDIDCTIVAEAADGAEGLKRFHETKPDVIITDLKMPEMSGEEFCKKIRSVSDNTALIFLSAYESFTAAQQSLHYGVIEYILKPIDARKLAQITNILKRLSSSMSNHFFLNRLMDDPSLQEEFTQQLRCRNEAYFENFFQNLSDSSVSDFSMLQRNAAFLIGLLFDVMEEAYPDHQQKRHSFALSEMSLFSLKTDIVNYIKELYQSYLTNQSMLSANNRNSQLTEQVKLYIMKNLNNPQLSVASIADHFGFSSDYLSRSFKRDIGVSLTAYIGHLRLNQACRLLMNTQLSIAEIAQCTGYSSTNYFCRSFKKLLDISPTDYRIHKSQMPHQSNSSGN
ncbi:MAG: response regulator [Roseburia sp.]|nr:response regulator [Roseburia sp.]